MSDFHVPGFDVVELLGYGSGGEVWLARERSSGNPVALKRLRAGSDLAARDRLRREAAVLAGVDHPHVVRLRSVVGAGDALVLVLDLATGGSLARLLASRRRLTAGEVVTIAVPLAQALADVHARGLVHGDVTPANVLFMADGCPVLSDLGVSRLLGSGSGDVSGTPGFLDPAVVAGGAPDPASDVHGLAATCVAALTGASPYDVHGARVPLPSGRHALLEVLERALAPDPAARPGAAQLARAVWEAATAEPVRLVADDDEGPCRADSGRDADVNPVTHPVRSAPPPVVAEPEQPAARLRSGTRAGGGAAAAGRRGAARWRTALALLLSGTALTMAAVTGIAWAGAGDGSPAGGVTGTVPQRRPAAAPSPTTTTPDRGAGTRATVQPPTVQPSSVQPSSAAAAAGASTWAAVLGRLDAARSRAFSAGAEGGLAEVYLDGSPALRRDREVLERLSRSGLRAERMRLDAVEVRVLDRAGGSVRLQVVDVMADYRLVDGDGAVVDQRMGRGATPWTVTLRRSRGEWRIYDVARG